MRAAVALIVMLVITGCHRAAPERQGLDALDDQLTGNTANLAEPATPASLHDQIRVDPGRLRASGRRQTAAVRPIAPTNAGPAARSHVAASGPARGASGSCGNRLDYSGGWASRLPPGLALYPGATVSDAAGGDGGGCALIVVSFTSSATAARVADWYATQARAAGYAVEDRVSEGRHTLGGDRQNGAFLLEVDPNRDGGTDADLIVDNQR